MTDGPVEIVMHGSPVAKGRPHAFFNKKTGQMHKFPNKKSQKWEGMFRFAAMQAMDGRPIMEGPVQVVIKAIFDVPTSWPEWKKDMALCGRVAHTKKPDGDNIAKAVKDAMNGVVYKDDSLVARTGCIKSFGERAMVVAEIKPMDAFPSQIKKRPYDHNQKGLEL